jgi:hypothetical protein
MAQTSTEKKKRKFMKETIQATKGGDNETELKHERENDEK